MKSELLKEQLDSWQGWANSPSPKVFVTRYIPELSPSERDFSLLSVELLCAQLLRSKGFESSDSCTDYIKIT